MKFMKPLITLAILCLCNFSLRSQVSFLLSQSPGAGSGPDTVVAMDVNGDGKPDLMCVNAGDNTLTVFTNNGLGQFSLSGTYAVGSGPQGLTAADIFGNGHPALICDNYNDNSLTILTNNGAGAFSIASEPADGSSPTFNVLAADINGDNKIDLICPNFGGNSITVLTNNGAGGFAISGSYVVGNNPQKAVAADVNNDGKPDLITAIWNSGSGNSLTVLTNNGKGGFVFNQSLTVGNGCTDVAAADVNQDGFPDLISANYNDNTITVLTNNTQGGFAVSGTYATGANPCKVVAGDVNGDGYVDLVALNRNGNTVTVLTNNHFGGFLLAGTFAVGNHPVGIAAADIIGNGKLDLITANQYDNDLTVLTNATVIPLPPIVITSQPASATVTNDTGAAVSFTVLATNNLPLSYQWYFNGTNSTAGLAGAYAETISGFVYGAVVTNGGFGYGNVPSVSFVGGGGTGAAGYATVSNAMVAGITVTNAGSGYTSAPGIVIGAPNGLLFGQTNNTLTVTNISSANAGNYYVIVSNTNTSLASSVATLTVAYPPAISINPTGFVASIHGTGTLSVAATGTPPLSYQWQLNSVNLTNATNSSYTIASLNTNNTGNYTVVVSSPYGAATSLPAVVAMSPDLTVPFTGAIGLWGQNTVLSVGAIGSGTLSYQWYFNGGLIPGANGSSYDLDSIQFTNAGLYSVVVSSAYGSVTNTAYQVVVNPANIALGTFPGVYITGTVGYNYTIQGTTNLADPNAWVTITNLTLTSPMQIWFDGSSDLSQPANPRKFYRVQSGQ